MPLRASAFVRNVSIASFNRAKIHAPSNCFYVGKSLRTPLSTIGISGQSYRKVVHDGIGAFSQPRCHAKAKPWSARMRRTNVNQIGGAVHTRLTTPTAVAVAKQVGDSSRVRPSERAGGCGYTQNGSFDPTLPLIARYVASHFFGRRKVRPVHANMPCHFFQQKPTQTVL